MSRLVYDGNYKVFWLAAKPANTSAPTTTEISAGTEITAYLTKDGFNPNVTNNRVTGGDLSTKFTDESMGTWSAQLAVTGYMDDGASANVLWDTLADGASGCIIACPFGAPATGDLAHVFPDVECGVRQLLATAENARQKFTVEMAVRAEPVLDAAVA